MKVNNETAISAAFTITALPSGWSDGDVGSVGLAGSAAYASGVFTVKGSGNCICSTADAMHFVYQSLSGDGTVVARVASSSGGQAGVMVRETLNAGATDAFSDYQSSYINFYQRPSTGGNTTEVSGASTYVGGVPYWIELVRSGNSFTAYTSFNGLSWTQLGSQTITMATNVYIGLAVSSENNSSLATATFDNVSVSSTTTPAPAITSLSATTGPVGTQVTISGSGFGTPQGVVTLNAAPVGTVSWGNTSVVITIPSGAVSGNLVAFAATSLIDSNPMEFEVTSQPLPASWLDQDVGSVGVAGSATYVSGVFTVKGSGNCICSTADAMHFVYQSLSGDGTVVARVASSSGGQAGVMVRETLNAGATDVFSDYQSSYINFYQRPSTGGNTTEVSGASTYVGGVPYWIELVRSGNSFTAYTSFNGLSWTQLEARRSRWQRMCTSVWR